MKASSSSGNEGKYKKLRILLVDDEPDVVEVFGRGLKFAGMRVDAYITTCFLSAFEIQADEFKSVFPSMDSVKAIIKKPISINELLNEIAPFLKILAAAKAAQD